MRRKLLGVVVTLIALVAAAGLSGADMIVADALVTNNGTNVNISGDMCDDGTYASAVTLSWNGNSTDHFTSNATLTMSHSVDESGTAITFLPDGAIALSGWQETVNTGQGPPTFDPADFVIPATLTVPTDTPDGDYHLEIKLAGDRVGGGTMTLTDHNLKVTVDCGRDGGIDEVNSAPVVDTAAADADGTEGDTLSTSGKFTDADGDGLTLTADNTEGTFIDNGNGTWSWSLVTNDDVLPGATITVTADDGNGGTAADDFHYSAVNADPVLGPVALAGTGQCSVSVSASFTDAGSADTHTATIAWGDSTDGPTATTSPVTGAHTFTTPGTYSAVVTVTDDDLGSDSGTSTAAFTTLNAATAFLEPINAAGTRSTFKLGSTIPLKIRVTACGGGNVSGLTDITITAAQLDDSVETNINEVISTASPTSGKVMRYDTSGAQYIYNWSTKNSTVTPFTVLTAGSYKVRAVHPSFFTTPTATLDLKK
jgi:hypothetical protein